MRRPDGPTTERALRRRFVLLTGLRWLPIGFLAPVMVLLTLESGLTLPQTGLVFAAYGATTALLELPTGGLADALGRRIVLLASSVAHLAFFVLMALAGDLVTWLVAGVVGGVARALDSGPLEAWYVDEARRLDPDVELRPGLSAAGVVEGAGLALSALASGFLPLVFEDADLGVVAWAAFVVQAAHLVAVLTLMAEHRPAGRPGRAWREGLAQLPVVVRTGLGIAGGRGPVRLLMLGTAGWGVALVGVEMLWQPRFVDLLGGDPDTVTAGDDGTTVALGALMAGGFLVAALGSMLAPWLARRFGGSASRGALAATLLQGGLFVALAAAFAPLPAAAAFLGFYLANGLRGPLHSELLHEHVTADRRSTMLSVESLTLQAGGFCTTLVLPVTAAATGIPWAWAGVGVVVALSALVYRGVPDRPGAAGRLVTDPHASGVVG